MHNTVRVPRSVKYLEKISYILLLCFAIPIKVVDKSYDQEIDQQYKKYLQQFNKSYDEEAYERKLEAFKKSLEDIEKFNSNRTNSSAYYGLTKYSDLLPEEFLKSQLLPNITHYFNRTLAQLPYTHDLLKLFRRSLSLNIPEKVDWRKRNVVTDIHSQESCGACWAFAAIEITESISAIKTGKLEKLSVQEMIDCAKNNDGCDGGDVYSLLDWMKTENVKVVSEQEYPLVLVNGKCRNISSKGVQIADFECGSFVNSEDVIIQLLAKYGPVAVAINAQSWQNYVSGIIQFHCDGNMLKLNHAVQIVGYDLTAEIPHYIVRNSWGKDFGDDGYLYIAIGKNLCGLAQEVCSVEVL